jgi:hypothetical protein
VPIVQAATAYDDPETGITYILVINQALQIPNLQTMLLNPNQMRMNGIFVDDIPKHLAPDPELASHSIFVPSMNLRLPLQLKGIISGLRTRYPSVHEVESCQWIELTSSQPWDPRSESFEEREKNMEKHLLQSELSPDRSIYAVKSHSMDQQHYMDSSDIVQKMINTVKINAVSSNRSNIELRDKIGRTFGIGIETANCVQNWLSEK